MPQPEEMINRAEHFLAALGLDLKLIVSGFAGGVVHAAFFKQTSPWTVMGSVISGIAAANYLADTVSGLTHMSIGACGFLTGFGAMALIQGLVEAITVKLNLKRVEKKPSSSDGGDESR